MAEESAKAKEQEKLGFDEILAEELEKIEELRRLRGVRASSELTTTEIRSSGSVPRPPGKPQRPVIARAHGKQLVGLAFSGGGIRSATFNLGILQALAQLRLLRHFDYLSTVSGGGYIGGWLVAWIKRQGLRAVCEGLKREHPPNPGVAAPVEQTDDGSEGDEGSEGDAAAEAGETRPRVHPITFLRSYSNYLTPQTGIFSLDTWMAAASYLRNLILNLHVLVLALGAVLLLPYVFLALVFWLQAREPAWWNSPLLLLFGVGLLGAIGAWATAVKMEISWTRAVTKRRRWLAAERGVFWTVILPISLLALLLVLWLYGEERDEGYVYWALHGGAAYTLFWAVVALCWWGFWIRDRARSGKWHKRWRDVPIWLGALAAAFGAGFAASWLLAALIGTRAEHTLTSLEWLKVATWAPPGMLLTILLTGIYFIGLMGRSQPEEERQWWSRMGGWVTILAAVWWGLFLVAFYAPPIMRWLAHETPTLLGTAGAGWVGSTLFGVLAGRSAATDHQRSNRWLELATRVTPYVFVIGLLMLLAWFLDWLLPRVVWALFEKGDEGAIPTLTWTFSDSGWLAELARLREAKLAWTADWLGGRLAELLAVLGIAVGAALLLSWRLDVNEFSMHNFYRDRLTRPYLGASRRREPNPFTGFDRRDDLRLCHLLSDPPGQPTQRAYDGPFPLVNTAVNITSGAKELAWQERQANSFLFTPLHHGFEPSAAEKNEGREGGVRRAYRRSHLLGPQGPERERRRPPGLARPDQPTTAEPTTAEPTTAEEKPAEPLTEHRQGPLPQGISLGTAITVSGAAVNPAMGYHSAPALAFLLTLFNARLGLWMGNPAHETAWKKKAPTFSLEVLLSELFGMTSADSKWVNLADGGFFDNLGVYELVRRRCRFILACDVEADPGLEFNGLGNVIRRCRTDFGIEIRFENLDPLRLQTGTPFSRWHCAVGKILYNRVDVHAPEGILVYIKATLTGDEPADLLNYHRKYPQFPHQSTGDQWFEESQFESYRRLGQHIGLVVFGALGLPAELVAREVDEES